MLPPLPDILSTLRVVSLPMTHRFRGIDVREVALFEGPAGWTEFSPFVEYDTAEASAWLTAALDFGWQQTPAIFRSSIRVNATMPVVDSSRVPEVLARFPGCRTVKIKVADPGQGLTDDVARVAAVRKYVGPEGRIRVDANGLWTVDEAERAIHALAEFDLEYVEQPCETVEELADIRSRVAYMGVPIAADESVRKAEDPARVARVGAADLLVVKAQPLGGIRRALDVIEEAGLPVVVSSALETSVGISMGAYLGAAIDTLPYDCGLATVSLLTSDITAEPLLPHAGTIDVRRVVPDPELLDRFAAEPAREAWWRGRIVDSYRFLDDALAAQRPSE
ncbi:o-succinylbenzoate synthase [Lacisediminihabitans changchengi]|uniref:o-succinylbenzoate synthase n=1 Tax=Lacisediminihabitans changchengi TaxID=2787634 RepID=A0A934SP48_9MICO|nr:o-succinylbenzoate synthase [Lacisediminihabitans changchengi]MBK4349015.1 o-succinylbenzoate synthase [Lacisediminihabitans changchengi]